MTYNNKKSSYKKTSRSRGYRKTNGKEWKPRVTAQIPGQATVSEPTNLAVNRVASFDVVSDANISTVGSSAPIVGTLNPVENIKYSNNQSANLRGAIFDKYHLDSMPFIASASRAVEIRYRGIQSLEKTPTEASKADLRNYNQLEAFIQANQTTDMEFFKYVWSKPGNNSETLFGNPQLYMLYLYQKQLLMFASAALMYELLISSQAQLVSQFPKYAKDVNKTINELKARRRRRTIDAIKLELSNHYFDVQYFKQYLTPCLVVSKASYGFNSPFIQLHPSFTFPVDKVKLGAEELEVYPKLGVKLQANDPNPSMTHLVNSFSVHEFIKAMLKGQQGLIDWVKQVDLVLKLWDAELSDFSANFIAVKSFLDRADTSATLTWTKGLRIDELPILDKLSRWMLSEEMLVHLTKLGTHDENGYSVEIPLYNDGLHINDIKTEYSKFYLVMEDEISYVQPGKTLEVVFRSNPTPITFTADSANNVWINTTAKPTDVELYSKVLSLRLPKIELGTGTTKTVVSNPNFITMISVRHVSTLNEDIVNHKATFVFPSSKAYTGTKVS